MQEGVSLMGQPPGSAPDSTSNADARPSEEEADWAAVEFYRSPEFAQHLGKDALSSLHQAEYFLTALAAMPDGHIHAAFPERWINARKEVEKFRPLTSAHCAQAASLISLVLDALKTGEARLQAPLRVVAACADRMRREAGLDAQLPSGPEVVASLKKNAGWWFGQAEGEIRDRIEGFRFQHEGKVRAFRVWVEEAIRRCVAGARRHWIEIGLPHPRTDDQTLPRWSAYGLGSAAAYAKWSLPRAEASSDQGEYSAYSAMAYALERATEPVPKTIADATMRVESWLMGSRANPLLGGHKKFLEKIVVEALVAAGLSRAKALGRVKDAARKKRARKKGARKP